MNGEQAFILAQGAAGAKIGNLADLDTQSKGNLVEAINEAYNTGGGGGVVSDHRYLTNRDAASQHPISAITGLQSIIDGIPSTTSDLINDSGFITEDDIPAIPEALEDLTQDSTHRTVTDAEKTAWNAKQPAGNYATSAELAVETAARQSEDTDLQSQIDAIVSKSDVVDVVATYAELQSYDTSELSANDVVKVLSDSTHNNARTYYRWVVSGGAGSWSYVGAEPIGYTKSETDQLLNGKQDTISDLATIRTGASAGATAVQPEDLATVATSGAYADLTGKPTIPSAVTESTVSGWGFTKNTGTYSKPTGGIPKTDLDGGVQSSLGKADGAVPAPAQAGTSGQVLGLDAQGRTVWITQQGGGGGTSDHTQLINRDSANQHPMSAITGLPEALATKGTYTKPSGGIPKADLAADTEQVFWATYGTTTYSSVAAAHSAGKTVLLKSGANGNVGYLTCIEDTNGNARFTCVINNEMLDMTLTQTNVWSNSRRFAEQTANKVTAISSESTDTQYPSAKAVYNYAFPKSGIWTGTQAEYDAIAIKDSNVIYMIVEAAT